VSTNNSRMKKHPNFINATVFLPIAFLILVTLSWAYLVSDSHSNEWPQWRGPNRDGVWNETGIIDKFPDTGIKVEWSAPVAAGYSGPTVADGRVYVTDRITSPEEMERVHCFDWENGKALWTFEYPCTYKIQFPLGPRASVSIDDGRAYSLGAMGDFYCFDAASGKVLWHKNLKNEYRIEMPIWGIAASPIVEGNLIIVQVGGADGACLVAFDKRTGEEKWKAIDDPASYSSPIIINEAGKRVLVCWTGAHVAGLDPGSGHVYWKYPTPPSQMVVNITTPVFSNDRLFVSNFLDGSWMLQVDQNEMSVEKVWHRVGRSERNTDSLHSIISTPLIQGDYIYGVDSYGELRCLQAQNGDRIWEDLSLVPKARWATVHMVRNENNIWAFNELGELIICELSPSGLTVLSRAQLIEPTSANPQRDGGICWVHPAYAYKHVFARNDKELICASLAKE
jgi:outer membrane protein assembly factor BamB